MRCIKPSGDPLAKLVRTLYLLREVKIKGTDAQSYPTVVVVRMRDHATHLNMHVQQLCRAARLTSWL